MIEQRTSRAIQSTSLHMLNDRQRRESSLYINEEPVPIDTVLGPTFQKIVVRHRNTVLVFVDDNPTANFAHECRYLLFDADTGARVEEIPARFPPYPRVWPKTYRWFGGWRAAEPGLFRRLAAQSGRLARSTSLRLRGMVRPIVVSPPPPPPAPPSPTPPPPPIPLPEDLQGGPPVQQLQGGGRRLAILFGGSPDPAHVNTMEFCYRILVKKFGFAPADIRVLLFEGVLTTSQWEGLAAVPAWPGDVPAWPGDNKAFHMPVSGKARRVDLQNALSQLQPTVNDLLFIHTTGHGNGEVGLGSYLVTHDTVAGVQQDFEYFANHFGDDLHPWKVRQLLVLMQQCCAGGFQCPVMQKGQADHIAFASAVGTNDEAYNTDDLKWNCFARDWFAAFQDQYPGPGTDPLEASPDTGDGRISTDEAYVYAAKNGRPHERDTPRSDYSTVLAKLIGFDGQ